MKKVLSSLVVLAILVGMFVCLGAQAFAEEEPPTAIFAVSDAELSVDSIGTMKDKAPDCLIIDVNGLAENQGATGYSVVWRESDPMIMTDYAYIWPGMVQMFYVGPKSELVVLVGVNTESAAADIEASLAGYLPEEPYVIAIGPKEAASLIAECPSVDMFMTSGLEDEEASVAALAVGAAKLENVGSDEANPVCQVLLGEEDAVEVSAIPVPGGSAVADPGTGVVGGGPIMPVPDPTDVPTCNIWYKGGDGSVGSMPDVTDFTVGGTLFFPENQYYTYEGHNFIGWKVEGDETLYHPRDEYVVTQDITVTAQWEEVAATYTVTYAPGEGAQGTAQSITVTDGSDIDLYACPADFVYEGYDFAGWLADLDGQTYPASTSYHVTGDVTFTAQWTVIPVETVDVVVTFNAGEAAGIEGNGDIPQTVYDIGEGVDFGLPTCPFTYEGHTFTGWKAEDGTDNLYTPADKQAVTYWLTSDMTFTAQWQAAAATATPEPTEEPETKYTISFAPGEGASGEMESVTLPEGSDYELPACTFNAPENMEFAGWSVDGAAADPEAKTIPVLKDTVLTATWKAKIVTFTVTYTAGEAAAVEGNADKYETCEQGKSISTMICPFRAPEGKTFSHWAIGEATYGESVEIAINADTTITAIWKDAVLPNIDATPQDPNDANIEWTRGDTEKPSVTFNDAQIATVSIGTVPLTAGSQVSISGNTMTLEPTYLDTLPEGPYTVSVNFADASNGAKYNPYNISLAVSIPPAATPAATLDPNMSWDRSRSDWYHNFGKQITKLEIYYGGDNPWREAKNGTDYYISGGTTLYLKQAMVNGGSTWGGKWEDVSYTFRVTYAPDGATEEFKVKLSGKDNVVGTPVATPVPTNANGVPVTGDETPIVTYIVVLAVLIVALAAVLIIVMKRRRGAGGRH